jgi:hypothetical protein
MSTRLFDRDFYRSSGRADWGKLVLCEAGLILVAASGAVLTHLVDRYLFHLLIIMPLFSGFALGVLGDAMVEASRCRNRWLAAAGGLLAGCVLFFGTYYVELIWALKGRGWTRFDLIPDVIAFDLKNAIIFAHHGIVHAGREPSPVFNGIVLFLEFLCVIGPAAVLPFKRAGKLYCEECQRWARSFFATVDHRAADPIATAIATQQWDDLPEIAPFAVDVTNKKSAPYTLLTLEHCPDAAETGCPVYLTIRRHPKDAGPDGVYIRRLEIGHAETLQLMARVPGLRGEAQTDDGSQ